MFILSIIPEIFLSFSAMELPLRSTYSQSCKQIYLIWFLFMRGTEFIATVYKLNATTRSIVHLVLLCRESSILSEEFTFMLNVFFCRKKNAFRFQFKANQFHRKFIAQ